MCLITAALTALANAKATAKLKHCYYKNNDLFNRYLVVRRPEIFFPPQCETPCSL